MYSVCTICDIDLLWTSMLPCRLSETKQSNWEYWKPAMMIGLGLSFWRGQDCWQSHSPLLLERHLQRHRRMGEYTSLNWIVVWWNVMQWCTCCISAALKPHIAKVKHREVYQKSKRMFDKPCSTIPASHLCLWYLEQGGNRFDRTACQ